MDSRPLKNRHFLTCTARLHPIWGPENVLGLDILGYRGFRGLPPGRVIYLGGKNLLLLKNPTFLKFWLFPCLHYFVNISANFNSIIEFLYIFQQPTEWAVKKCPQLILRMLQELRNGQKTITPFFWNTLYNKVIQWKISNRE